MPLGRTKLDHQNQLKIPVLKLLVASQMLIRMETKLLPKNNQRRKSSNPRGVVIVEDRSNLH